MTGLYGTTQGPWALEPCRCGHWSCKRAGTSNGVFYQGTGYDPEDARAIALVPEMLALVARMAARHDNDLPWNGEADYVDARAIAAKLEEK